MADKVGRWGARQNPLTAHACLQQRQRYYECPCVCDCQGEGFSRLLLGKGRAQCGRSRKWACIFQEGGAVPSLGLPSSFSSSSPPLLPPTSSRHVQPPYILVLSSSFLSPILPSPAMLLARRRH